MAENTGPARTTPPARPNPASTQALSGSDSSNGSDPRERVALPLDGVAALAAQFDTLLAGAPLGIGIFDSDCRHVRVNAVLAQMNGRTSDELTGRTPSEVNGEVGIQAEQLYRQVMAEGVPMRGVRLSGEVSARPGDVRHWELTFHPIRQPAPASDDAPLRTTADISVFVDDAEAGARRPGGAGAAGAAGAADPAFDGAVVGLCVIVDDVTVETQLGERVAAASARIEQITESMAVGYLAMDADWRITYVNAQAVTALGRPRQELVGGIIWHLFPDTAGTAFEAGYRRARTSGQPFTFDGYYPPPLDAWYEVRATPEGDGVALYFTDITARVAAQRAVEAAVRRAQLLALAGDRLAGLSDAEEALAELPRLLVPAVADWAVITTVDGAATAGTVTPSAAGPVALADRERRAAAGLARMRDVAFHHRDPAMAGWLAQYALSRMDAYRSMPSEAVSPFIAYALVDGRASVVTEDATAALLSTLPADPADPAVQALTALAPVSAVAMPLVSRGRTIAMVSLCWSSPDTAGPAASPAPADPSDPADSAGEQSRSLTRRPGATPVGELGMDPVATRTALAATGPTPEVVDLVQAIAERAAAVIEAITAAQRQLEIAEELQRSLLTAPPEPDHAHIVVRYVPAAAAAQVGGDWYDAFIQPSPDGTGATVLVIGDVLGHDISAAAAMGQVRTLVRAAAVMTGDGPAQVLAATDAAMKTLAVGTTATAVVARLEQDDEQVARAVTTLRWSSAGHPPPLVLTPDGSVSLLDESPGSGEGVGNTGSTGTTGNGGDGGDSDLLLGVLPDLARHEHTVELARGSTVLLYTDGLVERRGESLEVGLQRLVDTAGEVAASQGVGGLPEGLGAFCDEVLARMLPSRPSDDVALIAVRLHLQDRPRPVEAGGRRLPGWVAPEPQVLPHAGQPDGS